MNDNARRRLLPATVMAIASLLAIGAWGRGERRLESEIEAMVRVPVNCDTPLVISKKGHFRVYVETTGVLPRGTGTCGPGGTAFRNPAEVVEVRMAVTAPTGVANPAVFVSEQETYERNGYRGYMLGEIDFQQAGTYVITTEADSTEVAVALGPDLDDVRNGWRVSAAILMVSGALMALVLRRLPRTTDGDDPQERVADESLENGWVTGVAER